MHLQAAGRGDIVRIGSDDPPAFLVHVFHYHIGVFMPFVENRDQNGDDEILRRKIVIEQDNPVLGRFLQILREGGLVSGLYFTLVVKFHIYKNTAYQVKKQHLSGLKLERRRGIIDV